MFPVLKAAKTIDHENQHEQKHQKGPDFVSSSQRNPAGSELVATLFRHAPRSRVDERWIAGA